MAPELLSISIVTYRPDAAQFAQVLRHLHAALQHLVQQRNARARVRIVDNGNDSEALTALLRSSGLADIGSVDSSGSNIGYGKAHNRAIAQSDATYHLIMNPDVLIADDALTLAVDYMDAHPDVAALSPHAVDGAGNTAYLCKRFPALVDLVLRGFAPAALKQRFARRLDNYENRELVARAQAADVDLISGCFMFCRGTALKQAGAFNPAYFLYFEDFALSLELRKYGALMYVPTCRIVHFGGHAGRKGLRHVCHFAASALKFYRHYGWKLL